MDTPKFNPTHPEVVAGDPFYAEAQRQDPQPHGCYAGVVFLTYEEDGHEWTERVPCRRCNSR